LLQETGFTLAELAGLFADPTTARDRWRPLAERKLAELDAQIHQAVAAKRLLEHALVCDCPGPEECPLVLAAGARRATQQPVTKPSRVASWRGDGPERANPAAYAGRT
jgi:hypothetical protein